MHHSFDECQTNLRNYSAWQAQGDITRSGQSFIHAIAVDQYTDDSPAVGPELITVQCADTQFRPRTPVPTPDFAPAIKVAETPLSQQELPVAVVSAASPDSPVEKSPAPTKTTTYLDPQESEVAKEFDAKYNVANQTELHTIVLGLITYDLKTRKLFKGGTTPFHFDDFSACRGEIANFVAYMTPYLKTLPHQPQRIAVYGGQVPGMQFVGRDPQSQKMLLIIPGCVEQTGDRGFVEDPDHKVPPPAFDAADKFVSEGSVK